MDRRPYTRSEARDTAEVLDELGLPPRALAAELRKATPAWVEILKIAPVIVALLGGFSVIAVRWDRAASKDDLSTALERVEARTEQRVRALEVEVTQLGKQVDALRFALDRARGEIDLRLHALELAPPRKRR